MKNTIIYSLRMEDIEEVSEREKEFLSEQFHHYYSAWLENPKPFAKIMLFGTTHFIFEISLDSVIISQGGLKITTTETKRISKSLNFVIKFLTSVSDRDIKKIFLIFLEIIDKRKQTILQAEKDAERCFLIRFILEILQSHTMPTNLFTIGCSSKMMCQIKIERQTDWLLNGRYNILCFGRVDAIIQLHIFGPNNLTEIPNKKVNQTFFIESYDTLEDVRDKMLLSGMIEEEYTIGSFYLENPDIVFDDDPSAKFTDCITLSPYPNDICCQIVFSGSSTLV
jgi:hypothetical protein